MKPRAMASIIVISRDATLSIGESPSSYTGLLRLFGNVASGLLSAEFRHLSKRNPRRTLHSDVNRAVSVH
jgi:hypothetical protein